MKVTNTGSAHISDNLNLILNGLADPVPIPLGAILGCQVCLIGLDVILFPLSKTMWVFISLVCFSVTVRICTLEAGMQTWRQDYEWHFLENTAKIQDSRNRNKNVTPQQTTTFLYIQKQDTVRYRIVLQIVFQNIYFHPPIHPFNLSSRGQSQIFLLYLYVSIYVKLAVCKLSQQSLLN